MVGAALIAALIIGAATQLHTGASSSTAISSSVGNQNLGQYLTLSSSIPLPPTQGRIDHMSVDLQRGLLFVACYVNNTVAVIDIHSGRFVRTIVGLDNPQGVAWVPGVGKLYVSNAGNGDLDVFNGSSFGLVKTIALGADADNMRFDNTTGLLYVGFGSGGIATVDPSSDTVVRTKSLPAHPESLEVEGAGRAVFVNVPDSNLITAFDKRTGSSILNRSMAGFNFPMALDESRGRLFVATRSPSELRVLDASSHSLTSLANVTISGDPDDIFVGSHGTVYVSCGAGSLEVIAQSGQGQYSVVQTLSTGQGARTSLLVPELETLFVAVPANGNAPAELLLYGVGEGASATSSTSVGSSANSTTGTDNIQLKLVPSHPIVPVGGQMAFSLVLNDLSRSFDNLSVSATAPPGLNVSLGLPNVNTPASEATTSLTVSSSSNEVPGTYRVIFHMRSSGGISEESLDFDLLDYVVQIAPAHGLPTLVNLTVLAGSNVTWYNLDLGQDGVYRAHSIAFKDIGVSSGLLDTFAIWSHEFDAPGVYQYVDTQQPSIMGEITVVPNPIPNAASLSLSAKSGPTGLLVTLSGDGYVPGAVYQACIGASGSTTCGIDYVSAGYSSTLGSFAFMATFVADSAGGIPASTQVAIPDLFPGGYEVGIVQQGREAQFVSVPFTVGAPTLSLGTTSIVPGGNVTVMGSGYAPSTTYTICMVHVATLDCGYAGDREEAPPGFWLGTFTTDAFGDIPAGAFVTVPRGVSGQLPQEVVGVFLPSGGYIMITTLQVNLMSSG